MCVDQVPSRAMLLCVRDETALLSHARPKNTEHRCGPNNRSPLIIGTRNSKCRLRSRCTGQPAASAGAARDARANCKRWFVNVRAIQDTAGPPRCQELTPFFFKATACASSQLFPSSSISTLLSLLSPAAGPSIVGYCIPPSVSVRATAAVTRRGTRSQLALHVEKSVGRAVDLHS